MKRIFSAVLAAVLMLALLPIPVSAKNENSGYTRLHPTADPGFIQYKQGSTIRFDGTIYSGMRSNGLTAAGLTTTDKEPSDMFSRVTGTINSSNLLYEADLTYVSLGWQITSTLQTNDVPVGKYRFYFIHTWNEFSGWNAAYMYQDIEITTGETPSSWAVPELETIMGQALVPAEMNKLYTSPITRADFVGVISQLIQYKGFYSIEELASRRGFDPTESVFTDVYNTKITAANKLGIINGVGGNRFNPEGLITRQEASTMLFRTAKVLGLDTTGQSVYFADSGSIAAWALEAVEYVFYKSIMTGVGGNMFEPLGNYTYEQSYLTSIRLCRSAEGTQLDTSLALPRDDAPLEMAVPVSYDNGSWAITSGAIDETERHATATLPGCDPFIVRLEADSFITTGSGFYFPYGTYILLPDGQKLMTNLWSVDGTACMLHFPLPKGADASSVTFVTFGQWRKLEGAAPVVAEARNVPIPLNASGLTATIESVEEVDSYKEISIGADERIIVLTFVPSDYRKAVAASVYGVVRGGYLQSSVGKKFAFRSASFTTDEPYVMAFAVPKSVALRDILFIFEGGARKLV